MEGVGGESGDGIARERPKFVRQRHVAQKEGENLMLNGGDGAKQSGAAKVECEKNRPGRQRNE